MEKAGTRLSVLLPTDKNPVGPLSRAAAAALRDIQYCFPGGAWIASLDNLPVVTGWWDDKDRRRARTALVKEGADETVARRKFPTLMDYHLVVWLDISADENLELQIDKCIDCFVSNYSDPATVQDEIYIASQDIICCPVPGSGE